MDPSLPDYNLQSTQPELKVDLKETKVFINPQEDLEISFS